MFRVCVVVIAVCGLWCQTAFGMWGDDGTISINQLSTPVVGAHANGDSGSPSVSSDGRFVVFGSDASNLVAGDTNKRSDVFLKDVQSGVVSRVSVGKGGKQGNGDSGSPSVSSDGRFVVFGSDASNLVVGDTNKRVDVFLKDVQSGVVSRVSVSKGGKQGNGDSFNSSMSSDGRFVVFGSDASNLVVGDTNKRSDVFLKDVQSGVVSRVSVDAAGKQGNSNSLSPSVSSDGRFVAFESLALNLVAGHPGKPNDGNVFLKDMQTGQVQLVSANAGVQQGPDGSFNPHISSDGRFVAFDSVATHLIPGDKNYNERSVYVKDIQTGSLRRISLATAGHPEKKFIALGESSISSDGRFITFARDNPHAIPGAAYRGSIFVKDLQSGLLRRVSVNANGKQANSESGNPSISSDGRFIAFESLASNLIAGSKKRSHHKPLRANIFGVSWQEKQLPAESTK